MTVDLSILYHLASDWGTPLAIIYLCLYDGLCWLLCVSLTLCVCVHVSVCVCDERDGVRPEACSGHGLRPPHAAFRMDLGLTQLPQFTLHSGVGGEGG